MSDEENIQEEVDNDEAPGIVHDILEEAVRQRTQEIEKAAKRQ